MILYYNCSNKKAVDLGFGGKGERLFNGSEACTVELKTRKVHLLQIKVYTGFFIGKEVDVAVLFETQAYHDCG